MDTYSAPLVKISAVLLICFHAALGFVLRPSSHQPLSACRQRWRRPAPQMSADTAVDQSPAVAEAKGETSYRSKFLRTLHERGFIYQGTDLQHLDELMSQETVSAYLGFDATADSLHVGSLVQIMILRHLQQCGHKPVVLLGGGTTKVGDPSGKDEARAMLSEEAIDSNIQSIAAIFRKFLSFGDGPTDAMLVNNDDWLSGLSYLCFLRDFGSCFSVNAMLRRESVKSRLDREQPLSFLEFNYMILQAYDFLELHRRYGVRLQMGGSDQWGNIVQGVELNARMGSEKVFGLTAPLITTSDGKKMGKTAEGAVWLTADKLSPYDYWQFWRNTDDADTIRFLKLFTEVPMDQIAELAQLQGADINQAKIVLADEATGLLHGRAALPAIHQAVASVFNTKGQGSTDSLPRLHVSEGQLASQEGVRLVELLQQLDFAKTKSDARRLILGGGARLNDAKVDDVNRVLVLGDFNGGSQVKLSAGKKKHGIVQLMTE
ncbi:unnamed protein product [Vitrella brassicaformis CCMP3155]|uniref:Tyrosine--tRNA ligase n=2 Tax=Vitrella brassicaformis TaxID=1169539 RepID=A0A0G4F1G5_VITBC|nr:unnamed protein product [Vitrella brassicaformis CCMP3155]|eukprot:CEM05568.1 unnamed protein product [Vitrella brassicaformis CCMP3155]